MEQTVPLLQGDATLDEALASREDMRLELVYPRRLSSFYNFLLAHQNEIEDLIALHLGSEPDTCTLAELSEWKRGNVNICIPARVRTIQTEHKVIIKIALPFKLGESFQPGNVEEKVRCEAGTHLWMEESCPTVPRPKLWGFGVPSGQIYTNPDVVGSQTIYGNRTRCGYFVLQRQSEINLGYLVIDHVNDPNAQLLSKVWNTNQEDKELRMNFLRTLARIQLEMSKAQMPWTGAVRVDQDGALSASNRPLTFRLHQLENKGISTAIKRDGLFTSAAEYCSALLSCHELRLLNQSNAIRNRSDCNSQLVALAAMRLILHNLVQEGCCNGPFVFQLTDIHPSNIFVDKKWNIVSIIDLEWACVRPKEMILPPVWLTGRRVDEISSPDDLDTYRQAVDEYLEAFEQEESCISGAAPIPGLNSSGLKRCLDDGTFWFFQALDNPSNPRVLCKLFSQHIKEDFASLLVSKDLFTRMNSLIPLWQESREDFTLRKLDERAEYEKEVLEAFRVALQEK